MVVRRRGRGRRLCALHRGYLSFGWVLFLGRIRGRPGGVSINLVGVRGRKERRPRPRRRPAQRLGDEENKLFLWGWGAFGVSIWSVVRLFRRLEAAGDTEDHRRRKGHRILAFSGGCRLTNFNKI